MPSYRGLPGVTRFPPFHTCQFYPAQLVPLLPWCLSSCNRTQWSTENVWGPIGSLCTITRRSWLSTIVFPWLGKMATHTEVGAWMHSRLCSQWEQTSQECGLDLLHIWSTCKTARWNHLLWICHGCIQYWVTLLRSVIEINVLEVLIFY